MHLILQVYIVGATITTALILLIFGLVLSQRELQIRDEHFYGSLLCIFGWPVYLPILIYKVFFERD